MTTHDNEDDLRRRLHELPVRDYDDEMIEQIITNPRQPRRGWGIGIALLAVVLMASTVIVQQGRTYLQSLATPSVTAATPSPTASSTPDPTAPATSVSATPSDSSRVVNPDDYRQPGGWYFTTADQSFWCRMSDEGTVCQAGVPVAGWEDCAVLGDDSPGAAQARLNSSGWASGSCAVLETPAGLPILVINSTLTAAGHTCEAVVDGVLCYEGDGTGPGILITTAGISDFGSGLTLVNPDRYRTAGSMGLDEQIYFASPSGNFLCGMGELVGCQATVPVTGQEVCGTEPSQKSTLVSWQREERVVRVDCTTQGIFVAEADEAGAPSNRQLPYYTALTLDATTCESRPEGVTCRHLDGSPSFTIASQGVELG